MIAWVLVRRVPHVTESAVQFARRFTYYLVFLLGIGIGLAFLGANVQPLLAIVLIGVVVVVLVLRGVADNVAAGVVIQTGQTVRIGDELQIEGPDGNPLTGVVAELTGRSILMRTADGRTVHIPNAKLLQEALVNNSTTGTRRSTVQVRVERPGPSVDDAVARVTEAAARAGGVASVPPPRALATTISPERLVLDLQFWHGSHAVLTTSDSVVREVAAATEAAGWRATVTSKPGAPPFAPPETV